MRSPTPLLRLLLVPLFIFAVLPLSSHGDEQPVFKPGDVIAFVGGEDMVAAAEYGYIETLITRALPDYKLKFRCLAWEGDTVFEQRRDINYPTLEQQLDKIGATVVIAQFGQLEALKSSDTYESFHIAYEKLLGRIGEDRANPKRRFLILYPTPYQAKEPFLGKDETFQRNIVLEHYVEAIARTVQGRRIRSVILHSLLNSLSAQDITRDGVHLNKRGHALIAQLCAHSLVENSSPTRVQEALRKTVDGSWNLDRQALSAQQDTDNALEELRSLIIVKNRLWHHYYRPQNWAFLAGDRTNQPSSRDHLDPSKRWFPEELEQFLPLIEQKEAEIHKLAASLAKP